MAQEIHLDQNAVHFARLGSTLDRLTGQITAQGIGVSEKLDHASVRLQKAVDESTARISEVVDKASKASEQHAKSLVRATWVLAFATGALVFITAVHLYFAAV